MQTHDYVFMPAGDFWPAARVDARLPPVKLTGKDGAPILDEKTGQQKQVAASTWLAKHAPVEQLTWCPGLPQLIRHRLVGAGGWIDHPDATVLNLYRPPRPSAGDAAKTGPWIEHVRRIYPNEADHIIAYLAHRVQRPWEKINHGLVLGGPQGIGKDTLLEPVKRAIGPWNFVEVSPQQMLGRFNGFAKCVVLRISEAKDMGEFDRFKFYDHMKTFLASPPDVLRVDEKNLREHDVFNVCAPIMTTNHKLDGIYLPADDRRHYVAWSDATKADFGADYWNMLWRWCESGGFGHVAAYLAEFDLSGFDPKAPPPKTIAFWEIVEAGRAPEDAELEDILDTHRQPGRDHHPADRDGGPGRRASELDPGSEEPAGDSAPAGEGGLRPGPQRICRRRLMEIQRQAPGRLCPERAFTSGPPSRGQGASGRRPSSGRKVT